MLRWLQVLQVLADPTHPDLAAKLRIAASVLNGSNFTQEVPHWVKGGVFSRLLSILRDLPAGRSPEQAAELCAGAAACLCGVICAALGTAEPAHLPHGVTAASLTAEACSPDVLLPLIHYGILDPAAAVQLAPGHEITMLPLANNPTAIVKGDQQMSRQYWTPRHICAYVLSQRLFPPGHEALPAGVTHVLADLVDPLLIRDMLSYVLEIPCSALHCPAACHISAAVCQVIG